MTELLEIRRPNRKPNRAAVAPENVMTCDVPIVTPRRPRTPAVPATDCRPTGRSPRTHRRGLVETTRNRSDVRTETSNTAGEPGLRSNGVERPSAAVVTRRRAWALGLLAGLGLAVLVGFFTVVGNGYEKAATGAPAATQVVHVRSGESLTSLAQRIAPELPAATVIETVRDLNDLQTAGLRPGQALVVPDYR
ncbi:MAG: LysM peptidoglycan-binding domain-containing protein [Gordonia sp. (in: high G+C Gram-positive bacteria)]|uniref:LysM peptidoglycan-binding domain-containing protein n=1 Tax=Gordonia sp. (in: high G+C Gram-positive bacteria) TaxID=84139 RepID=UPI0039E4B973